MAQLVHINAAGQFNSLLKSSKIVVVDFYADWCGPCKMIAPIYEQLCAQLSRPNKITFTKVNVDHRPEIASTYGIQAMPTFMVFKNGSEVERIRGANAKALSDAVKKLAQEAESDSSSSGGFGGASSSGSTWLGASLPRGYEDVTDQVDTQGLDLLNYDNEFGGARTLFEGAKPSGFEGASKKGKAKGDIKVSDWVESDTDEQLMLYIPFQSTLKVHTIHLTSLPPTSDDDDDDETPMRPKTIKIYTNRSHNLGFDEADDVPATQEITLKESDWDKATGTAKLELRFVKFQNITSVVLFVVDGEGDSEKTRIDRVRLIGDKGEKRTMGKLEKIGDDD